MSRAPFRQDVQLLPGPKSRLRRPVLALLAAAPFVFGLVALALGQSVIWDLRNYHWYNAYAFLTGRYASGIDFQPSQIQFFHNPLIELPFYLLATHLPIKAAFFILGAVQGLNFPLLFMLCWAVLAIEGERRKVIACLGLAALGMAGGMGIAEIGAPFYDNIASLGVLGAALLVVARFGRMEKAPWKEALLLAALAGLPLGIAAGLKMTTAVFCVGFCAALPLGHRLSERGLMLGLFFGLGILAGWFVAYGYWGWYLWSHYASPMFPYFNRIFHSPYVGLGYIEDFAAPRGLLRQLTYPLLFSAKPLLVSEVNFSDWRGAILYVLMVVVGLLSFVPRKKPAQAAGAENFLLVATAVSYVVWMSVEAYYRYLLPVEMLAPLLIVVCAKRLPLRAEFQTVVAVAALVAVICSISPADWGRRAHWADSIAKIERPALADSADTMILMTGDDAYAYMIPEFPPKIAFVRLESRGFNLGLNWGVNDLIRQRLAGHHGKFLLLSPARKMQLAEDNLAYFHLKQIPSTCREVTDDIPETDADPEFPKYYKLCDVVRADKAKR